MILQGNETIVQRNILASLLAGATAGMMVDLVLFPLDTIKTRLQSQIGFRAAGSFTNLYRGLSSAMIVSAPNGKHLIAPKFYLLSLINARSGGFFLRLRNHQKDGFIVWNAIRDAHNFS